MQRALDWLVRGDPSALEPDIQKPTMAFNLTVLSNLLGTSLEPDFSGVDLLIEEVSEHLYAIDRLFFHLSASIGDIAGLRLGRVSEVPENDRPFGATPEQIARRWCERRGIAYLGAADIGHDAANRIVPFGTRKSAAPPQYYGE